MTKRVCIKCGELYEGTGKKCTNCKSKKNYDDNTYYRRTKYTRLKNVLLSKAKYRASTRNLEFNLILEDFEIPNFCPVLGIPIISGTDGSFSDNSPSLDRIDSSKGYVKGNVAIISRRANQGKSNLTSDEHRLIAEWMDRMLGEQ